MNNNYQVKINEYIDICKTKSEYHNLQSKHSLKWYNLLQNLGTLISLSQGFAMTVLSTQEVENNTVAIVGASFSLFMLAYLNLSSLS